MRYLICFKVENNVIICKGKKMTPLVFFSIIFENIKALTAPKRKKLVVFSYNLNEAYLALLKANLDLKIKPFSFNGRIYSLVLKNIYILKGAILVKDLYNYIDSQELTLNPEEDGKLIIKYYRELKKEFNIDIFGPGNLSANSLSLKIFKKKHPEDYKKINMLTDYVHNFIKEGYVGGRNEIYIPIIKGKSYYYDINSLYLLLCKILSFPLAQAFIERRLTF